MNRYLTEMMVSEREAVWFWAGLQEYIVIQLF